MFQKQVLNLLFGGRFSSRVPKRSVMYGTPNFKMIVHASTLQVPTDLEEGSGGLRERKNSSWRKDI
jgi:hypothetical protein